MKSIVYNYKEGHGMPKIYRFVGLIIFSLAVLTVYDVPCYSQEISGQKMFGSPKEAFDTLIGAIREDNESALNEIFGPDAGEIGRAHV